MELKDADQVGIDKVHETKLDAIICASGFETRSRYIAGKLELGKISKKIALAFSDRKILARAKNDMFYKKNGFEIIEVEGNSSKILSDIVVEHILEKNTQCEEVNMLVDYSCMTKSQYASLIKCFLTRKDTFKKITIFFGYTPSLFVQPHGEVRNVHMGPIAGYCQPSLPDNRTALVVGLGFEKDRAIGLFEYVEPAIAFAFYAEPAIENKFVKTVLKNNEDLLARVGEEQIFRYPLADLRATMALLSSLCYSLKQEYRVIVAPLGPKPFALVSLLLACKLPDLDVWRVSAGTFGTPYDLQPREPILICRVVFEKEKTTIEDSDITT